MMSSSICSARAMPPRSAIRWCWRRSPTAPTMRIAVCFIEWSDTLDQKVVVDWTTVRDDEDAASVGAAMLAAPRWFASRTSISGAIYFSLGQLSINGLAIINTQTRLGFTMHTQPPGGLPNYYKENVIGGPGAVLLVVENFDTFADAITRKLVNEVAGTPLSTQTAALKPLSRSRD
jgi:hypothetical protein